MMKMAGNISATATPTLLVQKGDQVPVDITVKFAPNTFEKRTTLTMTPVLVFDGGEIAGAVQYVQGEKVKNNYTVIKSAPGGETSFSVSFPYDARAKISTLELRIEGQCRRKPIAAITKLTIAKGIVSPQNMIDYTADLKLLPDNFKKSVTVNSPDGAQIMYVINKADVRKDQLTSDQIKMFQDFVNQNVSNAKADLSTVQAKGYASPDGPQAFNDKLSQKRGESGQAAISKTLDPNVKYDISSYGEDWDGFQNLVQQSDMKDKDLVLQVLKMYSSSVQREQQIRNMSAVFKVLATDILPQLRRTKFVASADIKSKSDDELLSIAKSNPSNLSVEEALYIAPQIKDAATRIKVYQAAAQSGDARALNNLAVTQAQAGDLKAAAASIKSAAQKGSNPVINDNMGLIALANGDMKTAQSALANSSSPEAKAALAFANGDFAGAAKGLKGYNLAVARLTNNDVAGAKSAVSSVSPATAKVDYLKAVLAARQGDSSGAIANLKSAIKQDPSMAAKAKSDAEFSALFDSADFKALM